MAPTREKNRGRWTWRGGSAEDEGDEVGDGGVVFSRRTIV